MVFDLPLPVRFAHCDPAGIVFYPRYFEFFNTVVEEWCEHGLDCSFRVMHQQLGVGLPTVHVDCAFQKPSELGETIYAQLSVHRIGNASVHLDIVLVGQDAAPRVSARMVLALMDMKTRRAIPLPDSLRGKIARYLKQDAEPCLN